MKQEISIQGRKISSNHLPYVVAELSANHNGNINRAFEIMDSAKASGVDAIKIQTYTPDTMTIECDKEPFLVKQGLWKGYTLYDLYKEAQTPFEWQKSLFEYAKKIGITIFSTPFDETAVDLLESLEAPAYKVASFEVTDLPLIKYIAEKKKPIILSTGMANFNEISEAIETIKTAGCNNLIVLHCISGYPTPLEQANLKTMTDIKDNFNVLVGLSDHTLGITAATAAIALGATFIEKHFTLSRQDKGPDSEFSLEPDELKSLCQQAKAVHSALGKVSYDKKPIEKESMVFRRSLFVVKDVKKGDVLSEDNIRKIRPGYGLSPKYYFDILGKKASKDIEKGTPLTEELIDG